MDKAKVRALQQRLTKFGVAVIRLVETFPSDPAAKHIQNQVVRSGTAPALIYAEAQAAESKADFIHKMKVGLKELRETFVSLDMAQQMNWSDELTLAMLSKENDELISIFVTSIHTASRK
ncbi:MAG: four helix bundle protein [Chitinophagaceae bacterium]|nr:MAG: four helix bundle protein [Chitinophagaceae bacterium]